MENPFFFNAFGANKAKIAAVAIVGIVATGGFSATPAGQRFFSEVGISDSLAQTTDAAGRMVEKTSNAVQAFLGRSPGARGATDILKGKAKVNPKLAEHAAKLGKPQPTQRALGKTFDDPLQSLAGPMTTAAPIEFLPLDAVSSGGSLPAMALPIPVGGGFFSPVTGGFAGGGGGGGTPGPIGDGVVPPPPAPPPPPPIAAAVPEPSTWMLLLIGFAAVGASIRRGKAVKNAEAKRAGNCATAF